MSIREEFEEWWIDLYGTRIADSDNEFVGYASAAWDKQQQKINNLISAAEDYMDAVSTWPDSRYLLKYNRQVTLQAAIKEAKS